MADRSKRTETAGKREKLVKQERKNREQPRREKGKARETGKTGEAAPASTSIFPMRNSWLRSGRCWKRFWLEAVRLKR